MQKKPKDKELKATLEYEPSSDGEERLSKIFEFLLSEPSKCQKNVSLTLRGEDGENCTQG